MISIETRRLRANFGLKVIINLRTRLTEAEKVKLNCLSIRERRLNFREKLAKSTLQSFQNNLCCSLGDFLPTIPVGTPATAKHYVFLMVLK